MPLRRLLFVVLAVLVIVPGWTGSERLALLDRDPVVRAQRMPLDPRDPARRRVGRLTFMGGVWLTSPDPAFGGFSALTVVATEVGERFTLLSDGGNIVRVRLDAQGTVSHASFAELPGGPGTGWQKQDRDSESLAIDPATGAVWVGFERYNAIYRYTPGFAAVDRGVRPNAMRRWTRNGGPESLIRRHDGSFVAIQEEARHDGSTREVLVWRGDPTVEPAPAFRLRYRPAPGFDPSDATELPDGRLLILSRWWGPPLRFASRLELIDPAAIRPGATVRGRLIATLAAPLIHDNFEGVVATMEQGHTILWLVSDDNLTRFQRTLLLKFRLD